MELAYLVARAWTGRGRLVEQAGEHIFHRTRGDCGRTMAKRAVIGQQRGSVSVYRTRLKVGTLIGSSIADAAIRSWLERVAYRIDVSFSSFIIRALEYRSGGRPRPTVVMRTGPLRQLISSERRHRYFRGWSRMTSGEASVRTARPS